MRQRRQRLGLSMGACALLGFAQAASGQAPAEDLALEAKADAVEAESELEAEPEMFPPADDDTEVLIVRPLDLEQIYDPYDGIEPDGRIPGVERPEDLPNPDRWRYIPEGRIKPGNLFDRFLVSSFIAPFVFSSQDTGTSFGLAVSDIDFRKQRRREFAAVFLSYSTEGQQNYRGVWQRWLHTLERDDGGVFQEERSRVRVSLGYEKTLTRRFFGLGPRSRKSDESSYSDETLELEIGLEHSWPEPGDDLVLSGGIHIESHDLGNGRVSGEPDTSDAFDELFDEFEHHDMGWVQWGLRYDTRDSQANPYSGWLLSAQASALLVQSGGGVGAVYTLNGQRVFSVPGLFHSGGEGDEEHPPTDTVAFNLLTEFSQGRLPFFSRPSLGGSRRHRGYISDRFVDDVAWIFAAEYRFWILPRGLPIPFTKAIRIERVGLAPFYEVGSVAGNVEGVFESRVHHSYGIGLRLSFERQAPFRIDVGFSEDGTSISAGFGLSF